MSFELLPRRRLRNKSSQRMLEYLYEERVCSPGAFTLISLQVYSLSLPMDSLVRKRSMRYEADEEQH